MEIKQMQTQDIPAVFALAREVFDQVSCLDLYRRGKADLLRIHRRKRDAGPPFGQRIRIGCLLGWNACFPD